ncbi:hypothetical protein HLB09_10665, partial [Pseudokineococcus marinus]
DVAAALGAAALPAADAGGLAAALLLYQGTLHWNRFRGPATGPGDWLNGVGAVLCVAALGTLLLRWTGVELPGSLVTTQAWLLQLGAVLVLLGTLPTVASLAGLLADVRIWALTTATGGFAVALAARLVDPAAGTATSRAAGVVLVVVVALVSITTMGEPHAPRPPRRRRPRAAPSSSCSSRSPSSSSPAAPSRSRPSCPSPTASWRCSASPPAPPTSSATSASSPSGARRR